MSESEPIVSPWDKASARKRLQKRLLAWFDQQQRDLPWRKKKTPYRIWVSEIMLQQTQVATVVDYYHRFMKRFPTVKKLAAADQSEVLKLWEGLGYYRRARQMHAAAQEIVTRHKGVFPTNFDDVLALPGIGRYTAGAILSIATDQKLPILEGNTIRVFSRLMKLTTDPRLGANQKRLWHFSETLLPKDRCGDFNQSLMELGSEICHPRKPKCLICPIASDCPAFASGLQEQIPAASKKMKYEGLHEAVVVIERKGKYLIRYCGAEERWAGLWDFPRFKLSGSEQGATTIVDSSIVEKLEREVEQATGLKVRLEATAIRIKHAVTKYRITLDCFRAIEVSGRVKRSDRSTETRWVGSSEIESVPMSTTGRKIADSLG